MKEREGGGGAAIKAVWMSRQVRGRAFGIGRGPAALRLIYEFQDFGEKRIHVRGVHVGWLTFTVQWLTDNEVIRYSGLPEALNDVLARPPKSLFGCCGFDNCRAYSGQVRHGYCPTCREILKAREDELKAKAEKIGADFNTPEGVAAAIGFAENEGNPE